MLRLLTLKKKNNKLVKKIRKKKNKNKLLKKIKLLIKMKMMDLKLFKKVEVNLKQKNQDKLGKKIQINKTIIKNKLRQEILIM